ncbi:ABC transporter permease [Enterococcus casseliflavus]|uniref:ABC transporter permease n=1 Tax=Enterococcus casseliflavus TaxID=37734 RepID=UPI00115E9DF6|nr:ABC transporter permease [Enterococcus casseliflavus]
MEKLKRFFRRMVFFYKMASVISDWRSYIMFDVSLPVLQMICYSLIAYNAYGSDNISHWMIGNSLLIIAFSSVYNVGFQIESEKANGTLPLLVASKTKLWEIFFSSAISTIIQSVFSVFLGVSLISWLLDITWSFNQVLSFFLVLVSAVFVSITFGLLFSCFILISTEVNLITNTLAQILLIFTGANFPLSSLPKIFQAVPNYLPLTRSIAAAQSIFTTSLNREFFYLLKEEFFLGFVYLVLAVIVLAIIEKLAIKHGSLEIL